MPNQTTSNRFHSLDAVRAFALLLGIVFHSALSFLSIDIGWKVQDISSSVWVTIFAIVSHSFRMALFFLIAGFFAHLLFHRRQQTEFIANRFQRIVIPFVAGWFLIKPMLIFAVILGTMPPHQVDILQAIKMTSIHFVDSIIISHEWLIRSHLWFLYYLILFYIMMLLIRQIVVRIDNKMYFRFWIDQKMTQIIQSRGGIFLLALPIAFCIYNMQMWGVDTPSTSLQLDLPVGITYGLFFTFGWFLHRQYDTLLSYFSQYLTTHAIIACLSTPIVLYLRFQVPPIDAENYLLYRSLFSISYAIMMWSWVMAILGGFIRYLNHYSATWRYIADASYWLYLMHLPLVFYFQGLFSQLEIVWPIKLLMINLITISLLLLSYHYWVRYTFLGHLLNGHRERTIK